MAYGGFALICALILAHYIVVSNDEGGTFGFAGMPFALLAVVHHYAAIGARDGKDWGRKLSIIIATIMLFGIPIGTVLGIWVFTQTGDKWKGEGGMLPMEKKS